MDSRRAVNESLEGRMVGKEGHLRDEMSAINAFVKRRDCSTAHLFVSSKGTPLKFIRNQRAQHDTHLAEDDNETYLEMRYHSGSCMQQRHTCASGKGILPRCLAEEYNAPPRPALAAQVGACQVPVGF